MTWTPPATAAEFKARFDRDFPFGSGLDSVRDKDIDNAFKEARVMYNPAIWTDDDERKDVFLLIAAHFVWSAIQSAGGLSTTGAKVGLESQGEGLTMSKSVGPVSVSYDYPERIRNSPVLSQMMKSPYGQRFLQAVSPRLVGGMALVNGWSEYGEDA